MAPIFLCNYAHIELACRKGLQSVCYVTVTAMLKLDQTFQWNYARCTPNKCVSIFSTRLIYTVQYVLFNYCLVCVSVAAAPFVVISSPDPPFLAVTQLRSYQNYLHAVNNME